FLYPYGHDPDLPSSPTRRSSDLLARAGRAHDHGQVAMLGVDVDVLEHFDHPATGLVALDDALGFDGGVAVFSVRFRNHRNRSARSEEHTSELQSRENLVCRLLLE